MVFDLKILELIEKEKKRQLEGLELIPSENFVSEEVLRTMGSVFTNKYSEGYPNKRYYGGNEFVDEIENLAIDRAKKLFNAEHVNVQPNSGSPANLAVYYALLEKGDKVLSMNLSHGGHLTHGHKVNFSGRWFDFVHYGVKKENHLIDYEEVERLAKENKPKIILSGFSAYPRDIDFKRFHEIAQSVDAYSMADIAHVAGLIAGGVHNNPFPFTDVVTTTTHKTLRGPRSAIIMCKEDFGVKIDKAVFPGLQGGPHEHTIAAKAQCFYEALKPSFKTYAKQIVLNNKKLCENLKNHGLKIISDGTDNHLQLIDLTNNGITGSQAETALDNAGITLNKNMIPFDTRSPFNPSGIRLGTPALTTRGMKEKEMNLISEWISQVINNYDNESFLLKVREEIKSLTQNFPLFSWN